MLGVYLYVLLVYTVLCLLPVLYCVKFALVAKPSGLALFMCCCLFVVCFAWLFV